MRRGRRSVREGILVNVDNVVATPHGNRSDRGLSLRDLDRALARIHEEQRRLTLLIGLEGASYEEAARIIDVPIGTVRSRVSRGREAIRKLMDWRDNGGGERCGVHERSAEAPKPRPGR
jgi:RNA polymerase sigma-70 factor, ECF subfamily